MEKVINWEAKAAVVMNELHLSSITEAKRFMTLFGKRMSAHEQGKLFYPFLAQDTYFHSTSCRLFISPVYFGEKIFFYGDVSISSRPNFLSLP